MRHPAKSSGLQQCQANLARGRRHQNLSPSALAVNLSAAGRSDFMKVIHRHLDRRRQIPSGTPQRNLYLLQYRFSASKNPRN
jgi:hypothetical protein